MFGHIPPTKEELNRFHELMKGCRPPHATKEQVETVVSKTMERCERAKQRRQEARVLAYRDSPFGRIGPCVYPGRVRNT